MFNARAIRSSLFKGHWHDGAVTSQATRQHSSTEEMESGFPVRFNSDSIEARTKLILRSRMTVLHQEVLESWPSRSTTELWESTRSPESPSHATLSHTVTHSKNKSKPIKALNMVKHGKTVKLCSSWNFVCFLSFLSDPVHASWASISDWRSESSDSIRDWRGRFIKLRDRTRWTSIGNHKRRDKIPIIFSISYIYGGALQHGHSVSCLITRHHWYSDTWLILILPTAGPWELRDTDGGQSRHGQMVSTNRAGSLS